MNASARIDQAQLISLSKGGKSRTFMANHFGVSEDTIRRMQQSLGIEHRYVATDWGGLVREKVEADIATGLTFSKIALKYGVSRHRVTRFAFAHELKMPFKPYDIMPDKVVLSRRVPNGAFGGSSYIEISLPPISMYKRAVEERV